MLQARTPLVGLFDGDILPSQSLYDSLADPQQAQRLAEAEGSKVAWVVPAFELKGSGAEAQKRADEFVTTTKDEVRAHV